MIRIVIAIFFLKVRAVDIERTDSGVGSESSQASSTRGVPRRWRAGNVSSGPGSLLSGIPQVISGDSKHCEDCEQRLDPLITDRYVFYIYDNNIMYIKHIYIETFFLCNKKK